MAVVEGCLKPKIRKITQITQDYSLSSYPLGTSGNYQQESKLTQMNLQNSKPVMLTYIVI